jgi:hypothetical protein
VPVLVAPAILLVVFSGWAVFDSYLGDTISRVAEDSAPIVPIVQGGTDTESGVPRVNIDDPVAYTTDDDHAVVTVTMLGVDPEAGIVRVSVGVWIPLTLADEITRRDGSELWEPGFELPADLPDPQLSLFVTRHLPVDLSLAAAIDNSAVSIPPSDEFDLTADVWSSFPNDAYDGFETISLALPPTIVHRGNGSLPVRVRVGTSGQMRQFNAELVPATGDRSFQGTHTLKWHVERSRQTRFFVWAVALAPALLVLVLAHQTFRGSGRTFSLEAAAALLVVLPLRAVLVPQDVTGVTQLDRVLALELVAVIAVVAVGYALHLQRRRS